MPPAQRHAEQAVPVPPAALLPSPPATPPARAAPTPDIEIEDEFCQDDEYLELDGKSAFICDQCKQTFFPMTHMHGNVVYQYSRCREHIGVTKCKGCRLDLVGLDKILAHREVCRDDYYLH